jgi:hypothetical protein
VVSHRNLLPKFQELLYKAHICFANKNIRNVKNCYTKLFFSIALCEKFRKLLHSALFWALRQTTRSRPKIVLCHKKYIFFARPLGLWTLWPWLCTPSIAIKQEYCLPNDWNSAGGISSYQNEENPSKYVPMAEHWLTKLLTLWSTGGWTRDQNSHWENGVLVLNYWGCFIHYDSDTVNREIFANILFSRIQVKSQA